MTLAPKNLDNKRPFKTLLYTLNIQGWVNLETVLNVSTATLWKLNVSYKSSKCSLETYRPSAGVEEEALRGLSVQAGVELVKVALWVFLTHLPRLKVFKLND